MTQADFIRTLWEAAGTMGLLKRWETWAVLLAAFVLLVMHRVRVKDPAPAIGPEGIPEHPTAPPIPMPPGGAVLDQHPDPDQATKG